MEDSEEKGAALLKRDPVAYHLRYSGRYLGPGNIVMKFKNFNPRKDPKIEASQYEDSFPDVGREEMEKRFSKRIILFREIYDPEQPRQSLARYMKAAQESEMYKYRAVAYSGPVSLFLGGSVPKIHQKGELPECHLLGFVDGANRVGCMAHPLAETSQGYDGRDQVGFFSHTGCCKTVGCEASKEFSFLSTSALKVFDKAVDGMSWYQYSRHAISVLVYYLRCYDHLLHRIDERCLLDELTLEQLVEFTNALYDSWPFRDLPQVSRSDDSGFMNSPDILSKDISLSEGIMYIALGSCFPPNRFALQLTQARDHLEKHMDLFSREISK
jgi:hypothetical protein